MKPEYIAIISALGGVLIATLGNAHIAFVSNFIGYKKEIKKLVIEMSLTEWKERAQIALRLNQSVAIYPLILNLLNNSYLVRLIGRRRKLSTKKLKKMLVRNREFKKLIDEYMAGLQDFPKEQSK